MKFCWTTLNVKNMNDSLKFYQDIVKLEVNNHFKISTEKEIAFLGKGETQIELIWDKEITNPELNGKISIGFQTESLDELMIFLKEKEIPVIEGPIQPNPFIKFIFISDPNGLKIQFIEFC